MIDRAGLPCFVLLGLLACAGCSADEAAGGPAQPAADTTAPTVTLDLVAYTAVSATFVLPATIDDDVGVTAATVLIDGVPAGMLDPETLAFDSTTAPAGIRDLALEVRDAAGNGATSESVPVVLAGPGQFLPSSEWSAGIVPGWNGTTVTVPEDGSAPEHLKTHVEVPAGTLALSVFFRWSEDSSWGLGFDMGTGECPDSGTQLETIDVQGQQGVATITHDGEGTPLAAGQWFSHVRFLDPAQHANGQLELDTLVLALP